MSTLLTAVRSPFPAPATLDDTGIAIDQVEMLIIKTRRKRKR